LSLLIGNGSHNNDRRQKDRTQAGFLKDEKDVLKDNIPLFQGTFPGMEVNESFADRRSYSVGQAAVTSLAAAFHQLELCKHFSDHSIPTVLKSQQPKIFPSFSF